MLDLFKYTEIVNNTLYNSTHFSDRKDEVPALSISFKQEERWLLSFLRLLDEVFCSYDTAFQVTLTFKLWFSRPFLTLISISICLDTIRDNLKLREKTRWWGWHCSFSKTWEIRRFHREPQRDISSLSPQTHLSHGAPGTVNRLIMKLHAIFPPEHSDMPWFAHRSVLIYL